jgi:nucleoside-diphosphate-sugar epimerase
MRVFVTGASGFVGSAVVSELLSNRIEVMGLVRTEANALKLRETGATALLGDVNDLELITGAARECDAVIHTAFNHDFTRYKENCEADRRVITAFGDALAWTDKPLVITSGIGLLKANGILNEDDVLPGGSDVIPRAASEEAGAAAAAKGVEVYVVRLPPTVHGAGDHGFVPMVINLAKEKGKSAYIVTGQNRWPAVHRFDAASLYTAIVQKRPSLKVFHAVAEEGVPFKDIAGVIGSNLNLPVESLAPEEAAAHFTWFSHFAGIDCPSSAEKTKAALDWEPKHTALLKDMEEHYF